MPREISVGDTIKVIRVSAGYLSSSHNVYEGKQGVVREIDPTDDTALVFSDGIDVFSHFDDLMISQ